LASPLFFVVLRLGFVFYLSPAMAFVARYFFLPWLFGKP
jgi:hypothetical protein